VEARGAFLPWQLYWSHPYAEEEAQQMGQVIAQFTMSLDGFIAGTGDDVWPLFKWYNSGQVEFPIPNTDRVFKISRLSADLLNESWARLGALVTGRRDFDVSGAWGGKPPLGVPTFIVTHNPPAEWVYAGSPFTFVTEGVEHALAAARAAAGAERDVGVGGTTITRQCLQAGLLDELHIDLAAMLLGDGIRLFDGLGPAPIELEIARVVEGVGVTHLRYRVVK
jgi:dihydrofolate reductase